MKKKVITFFAIAACVAAFAVKIADDIFTRLGLQEQNVQWHIINNLTGRYESGAISSGYDGDPNSVYNQLQSFRLPKARLLADIISGDKTGAARELCDYVKKYVSSEEFATAYNKQREDAMPLQDRGASLAVLKRNGEVFQTNINNYKTDTKYVAEQQKLLDENKKRIDALIEAAKKPFPDKDIWEKTYPADPAVIVKKRLQEYLQLAATVDFKALLTGSGKQKKFVNPVYEKKSLKWKAIYRAGKEVNDAVTAFVKEWLKGEIISATKTKMTAQTVTPPATPAKATSVSAATEQTGNTNTGNNAVTTPAAEQPDATPAPKQKKSLFNKIKEKANAVTGN
jgi:hypothetical protein